MVTPIGNGASIVGAGTLGALVCISKGIQFSMGSGLDDKTRQEIWDNKQKYVGKYVTFKHFMVGAVDSFRFPVYKGFRDIDDMET